MLAIISGSGFSEMEGLETVERFSIDTPFGKPSGELVKCRVGGHAVLFLPRHGQHHSIPPHRVNYRANIWALKQFGAERIISISAVGGIQNEMVPGSIAIGNQVLDFTKNRVNTFFEENDVVHVDFTDPYCADMRDIFISSSTEHGVKIIGKVTYVAVEGPRLETSAEISFYRSLGADVIGMTAMPEAVLAREAELCYSGIYVVTNYAAGMAIGKLTVDEVLETMRKASADVHALLTVSLPSFQKDRACPCRDALKNARM